MRAVIAWKKKLIFWAVIAHFFLGIVALLPSESRVFEIPGLRAIAGAYYQMGFGQTWFMFSPPTPYVGKLEYSVLLKGGWTQPIPLDRAVMQKYINQFIIPRGAFRVITFFRPSNDDYEARKLDSTSPRAFYYQEISEFYCKGRGKIPGALGIHIYLDITDSIPFSIDDAKVKNASLRSLYEQTCSA